MATQGEFIIPQYSAEGHLIGWHTSHYEQGQVGSQQSSVRVVEEDVPRHRAKVLRTEPSDAASVGGRPMASTSRRQSSFTETRGKRQQFDIDCISSDDDDADDDPGVGQCRPVDVNVPVCKKDDVLAADIAWVRRVRQAVTNSRVVRGRSLLEVNRQKERDVLTVDAAKVRRVRQAVINRRAVKSRSFKDEQTESKKSQGAPGILFPSQESIREVSPSSQKWTPSIQSSSPKSGSRDTCGSLRSRARRV